MQEHKNNKKIIQDGIQVLKDNGLNLVFKLFIFEIELFPFLFFLIILRILKLLSMKKENYF